ncbi:MAG: ABC transporter permease [Phycisphaerales bacterium]|nr:ABC transporter permease [Phycisphaerales bacterium]
MRAAGSESGGGAGAPEQPTDLLAARAGGARPAGLLDRPGVRKFLRNRSGVAALVLITLFLTLAAAIALPPHLISLDETQERIGPRGLPGLWLSPKLEARVEEAEFYLDDIDKALRSSDPAASLAALRYAERRLAPRSAEEIAAILDRANEAFDAFDGALGGLEDAQIAMEQVHAAGDSTAAQVHDAGRAVAEAEAEAGRALEPVEAAVRELLPEPTGWAGVRYGLRMLGGTDRQGRSISLRAIYSIKTAVQIGMVTALIAVIVGSLLGGAAGFFGGFVDHAVVWLYSTLSSIPYIIWLVVIAFVFRQSNWTVPLLGKPIAQTLAPVYLAFAVTLWVGTCRVIRGEAMKIKGLDYIQSAVAIGCGPARILTRHVLPNVLYLMFINFSLAFVAAIKGEVILSYLGLGVQGQPSWGILIRDSKDDVVLGVFWELGAATLLMFVLVYAFNILSDALQDAFDPKHVG